MLKVDLKTGAKRLKYNRSNRYHFMIEKFFKIKHKLNNWLEQGNVFYFNANILKIAKD